MVCCCLDGAVRPHGRTQASARKFLWRWSRVSFTCGDGVCFVGADLDASEETMQATPRKPLLRDNESQPVPRARAKFQTQTNTKN